MNWFNLHQKKKKREWYRYATVSIIHLAQEKTTQETMLLFYVDEYNLFKMFCVTVQLSPLIYGHRKSGGERIVGK